MTRELEVAAAAEAAGEVLRNGLGQRLDVEYKVGAELVTQADEKAEQKIREVLEDESPSYEMVTEESGELEGEVDARWIVDPLDGTTNYVHGVPFFSVSIALERNGEVVLGVVHDPRARETYAAERGRGATLNGRTIGASDTDIPCGRSWGPATPTIQRRRLWASTFSRGSRTWRGG